LQRNYKKIRASKYERHGTERGATCRLSRDREVLEQ
jgi:hypothetical protein